MEDEPYKADKSLKLENNLKVEDSLIKSSSYDELKYIDEWIAYMKDSNNFHSNEQTSLPFDHDEDSSFSSIMNFYFSQDDKFVSSSEDIKSRLYRKEERKEVKLIKNNEDTADIDSDEIESVDLCHKENLVDRKVADNSDLDSTFVKNKESTFSKHVTEVNMSSAKINETTVYYNEPSNKFNQSNNLFTEPNRIIYDNKIPKVLPNPITITVTKIESPVFYNKRPLKKALLSQYFTDETSPNAGAFCLINEAKNRAMQQNKRTDSDIPLRKFVIETDQNTMNIKDAWKLNDLKNKTILGKISKMSTKGYYTDNWVVLRENFFSCYSTKPQKKSPTCIMNEKKWRS